MNEKTENKKEPIAKQEKNEIALTEADMLSDANSGLENVTSEDLAIPFLRITQAMSPQVWMPERKGLAGVHDSSEILKDVVKSEKGQDFLPNGNLLSTTANHYVLVLDNKGGFNQAILAFGGSQLKKSKKWNSIMSGLKIRTKDGKVFTPQTF